MGQTKLAKVIRIYYELVGPVCSKSARYMALGKQPDGACQAWAILREGYEPCISLTGTATTDPNDMTHAELDEILALAWTPVDELSTLEIMAREALPPEVRRSQPFF